MITKEQLLIEIKNSRKDHKLTLYNEGYTDVPPEICDLENLVELGLSYNHLSSLPKGINRLKDKLQKLWVSKNNITTFPDVITELINLQSLSLTYNHLITIPHEIGQLSNLKRLFLHDNQLTTIPPEIGQLNNLKTLDLYNNKIKNLPPEIGNLKNLQILDLGNNRILPSEIEQLTNMVENLTNLVVLNLCDNPIAEIAEKIGTLVKQGKGFYVSSNAPIVPYDILKKSSKHIVYYLTNTKEFREDILYRAISRIEYARHENMCTLDLSDMGLTELPINIGKLVDLIDLNLGDNNLTTLPPAIAKLTKLEELSLRDNLLQKIPSAIGKLVNLKRLDLNKNSLKRESIPSSIGKLRNLKELILNENEIEELPAMIGQLKELEILKLENNKLSTLPNAIGELINLQQLYLRNNELKNLPKEIEQLKNLEKLYLENNKLKCFPNEILKLTGLQRLSLDINKELQAIPDEIAQLTNLERLSLSNCSLQNFPSINNLKKLTLLDLRNNPCVDNFAGTTYLKKQGKGVYIPYYITNLPNEILQGKSWDIWYYLQDIHNKKSQLLPLNEAKLLLVGDGDVGKTCLANRLLRDTFEITYRTEGIDIDRNPWELQINDDKINLNVWDFGGQKVLHTTHQIFFTNRSFYILVLDARRDEQLQSRAKYWLKLIKSFGGDSPIFIAINKTDQEHRLILNKYDLKTQYPSIFDFYEISCLTGKGIAKLKQAIEYNVIHSQHIHERITPSWLELKQKLKEVVVNYLRYQTYQEWCVDLGITELGSQNTLCSLLHDLGIMLNFGDNVHFDCLRETSVLNPVWITNGIYKLLNDNEIFKNQGVFTLGDLTRILDAQLYPAVEHQFIISMMEKFELCFAIADTQMYLIPELLPDEGFYLGWNKDDSLRFEYHYDILPPSVFSRFIVRVHRLIVQKTYWRTGIVLTHDNNKNKALITANIEDGKIFVWVNGQPQTRRVLLGIIRDHFDAINEHINDLKVKKKVPYKDIVVDYQYLSDLETMGETTFVPEGLKERAKVQELLAGIENRPMTKKTILIVTANPSKTTQLRLPEEERDIGEGVKLGKHRDQFLLKQQQATRARDLPRAMEDHEPTIVHFCGHGAGEQGIVLEDNDGEIHLVSTEALANFFKLFAGKVECVVLNACFSEIQAKAIVQHIPYVIGMSESIGDKAAIEFSVGFYGSLAAGNDYERAYQFGCSAIALAGISGHLIPQLFKKEDSSLK